MAVSADGTERWSSHRKRVVLCRLLELGYAADAGATDVHLASFPPVVDLVVVYARAARRAESDSDGSEYSSRV